MQSMPVGSMEQVEPGWYLCKHCNLIFRLKDMARHKGRIGIICKTCLRERDRGYASKSRERLRTLKESHRVVDQSE